MNEDYTYCADCKCEKKDTCKRFIDLHQYTGEYEWTYEWIIVPVQGDDDCGLFEERK